MEGLKRICFLLIVVATGRIQGQGPAPGPGPVPFPGQEPAGGCYSRYSQTSTGCVAGGGYPITLSACKVMCSESAFCSSFAYGTPDGSTTNECVLNAPTDATGCTSKIDLYEKMGECCGYSHTPRGCVTDKDIASYPISLDDCKQMCAETTNCLSFEYGVQHGGSDTSYPAGDCVLNSGADPSSCNGGDLNLDLYVRSCSGGMYGGPVNGNWGQWSNYGACSRTCGPGTNTRSRSCTEPAPSNGGSNCPGSSRETGSCNVAMCPAMMCQEDNTAFFGNTIHIFYSGVASWQSCSGLCRRYTACQAWSYAKRLRGRCYIKRSDKGRGNLRGFVSGNRMCGMSGGDKRDESPRISDQLEQLDQLISRMIKAIRVTV